MLVDPSVDVAVTSIEIRPEHLAITTGPGLRVTVDVAESLVHGYIAYSGVVPAATEATGRGLAALRAALHD